MQYERITAVSDDEFVMKSSALIAQKIDDAIEERDECILGLSGGSTPRPVYEALGKEDLDWEKVKIFLIDDRHVPAEDKESNQKLVRDTLLKHADIPANQCYFPDTSLPIDTCVIAYIEALVHLFHAHAPDLLILGLGNDGHIASLFPPVSEEAFGEVIALHTTTDDFAVHDRISISPLIIMSAQEHVLLIKGEDKEKVFEECATSDLDPVRWPLHVALATERMTVIIKK